MIETQGLLAIPRRGNARNFGLACGNSGRQYFSASAWAGVLAVLIAAAFWAGGLVLIRFMTAAPSVREAAYAFLPWAALIPVAGVACFQLDGIYIGATRTADMRNMMIRGPRPSRRLGRSTSHVRQSRALGVAHRVLSALACATRRLNGRLSASPGLIVIATASKAKPEAIQGWS